MTLLSRKADYALLILSYLHRHSDGACAREIAAHFGLSRGFVANILKELCQKEFVTSQRGVNGGYILARSVDEISLGELLDSLDDGFHLAACNHPSPKEECSVSAVCPVRAPIANLYHRLDDWLHGVMLSELLTVSSEGNMVPPPALTMTAATLPS